MANSVETQHSEHRLQLIAREGRGSFLDWFDRAGAREPSLMVGLFSITVREVEDALVFELRGELDLSGRLTFEETVVGPPGSLLVVDLEGLTFIDSSGLGAIHRAKQIAEKDGGQVIICRPRPPVRRLFEISGLLGWLGEWDPIWSTEIAEEPSTSDTPQ